MTDHARGRRRYHLRLLLWLVLLTLVLLFAWGRMRRLTSDWSSPTSVAFVLVDASSRGLDPAAVELLFERVPILEQRLHQEFERYRGAAEPPFHLSLLGPVTSDVPAPRLGSAGFLDLIVYNFELWRFSRRCDQLSGMDTDAFQVKVYLQARAPTGDRLAVEGASQQGGPIGTVDVELSESSVDFALFVAAHELLHTRGATDKYGPDGLALYPDGFAEPDKQPLFPQSGIEIMARGRPIDAHHEEAPHHLDEITVGDATAAEIGWSRSH